MMNHSSPKRIIVILVTAVFSWLSTQSANRDMITIPLDSFSSSATSKNPVTGNNNDHHDRAIIRNHTAAAAAAAMSVARTNDSDMQTPNENETAKTPKPDDSKKSSSASTAKATATATECEPSTETTSGTIFLHVGPHKTGTTTIQDYFTKHTAFLRKYNTTYLGKVNPLDFPRGQKLPKDYVRPALQYPSVTTRRKLHKHLHKIVLEQGQNVILSDEAFASSINTPKDMAQQVFPGKVAARVIPIVVYRRFHERLVSLYGFAFHPKWYQKRLWNKWNTRDPQIIPSFAEFVQKFLRDKPIVLRLLDAYTHELQTITNHTVCPRVLHLDHPSRESVTHQFAALIKSQHTARQQQKHDTNNNSTAATASNDNDNDDIPAITKKSNEGTKLPFAVDSERFALYLSEHVPELAQQDRRQVVQRIQRYMQKLYYDEKPTNTIGIGQANTTASLTTNTTSNQSIPWQCPSEHDMALLWNQTRLVEDRLGLENPTVSLAESFQKYVREKRFCNLHLSQMWQDPRWKAFVHQKLIPRKKKKKNNRAAAVSK